MSNKIKHTIVIVEWTLVLGVLWFFGFPSTLSNLSDLFLARNPTDILLNIGFIFILLFLNIALTVLIYKGKGIFTQDKI